jgi:hypothetical protein
MGSKKGVVSAKLLIDKKGEAYVFRNDHHRAVYNESTAPLHGI